ncbi:probable RNA 3'-terminal phosphate cyclase-like protein [Drosophila sulfurigaster albostrigata]|uniref:probable RNA 3'-terminal phosphate cyclase-like protein n=1 Tax=Drosophila sulfurigaster albostrigata TaxID=89887 RepID=UPI002D21CEB7|nr:probable RNA 3'-terminal phosphate cyclase-like protein [Drosophila sulfurigaster albostrigata]
MPPVAQEGNCLIYRGSNFLKQRLVLSCLSGKPVKITQIRSEDATAPGLREYEISLIRLLDKLTNGTKIELNPAGTSVMFSPGLLHGGHVEHDCCVQRGIGYYLDALIALGPFCKMPLKCQLRGVTNSNDSPSVDHVKGAALSLLKRYLLVDEGLELRVVRRGVAPLGGGEIVFTCPVRKSLRAIQLQEPGMVKRIRGTVYACKVSPAMANRTVESAKGCMLKFLPDVYIYTDQNRGKMSGNSPGFGICLLAETTDGVCFAADCISNTREESDTPSIPEDLGREAAMRLLDEIYRGGCCDSAYQWLAALFMALGQKHVSKFLTGALSTYTVHFLQHLRDFFSVTFKLENPEIDDDEVDDVRGAQKVLMTCVGIGYTNVSKRVL